jgi:curved DNA-binding protein CbpA
VAEEHSDLYAELGVAADASPAEITHAYRSLLREHHPDTQTTIPPSPPERLRRILAAYTVLRDPARRAAYDLERAAAQRPMTRIVPATAFRRPASMGFGLAIWVGPVHWQPSPGVEPAPRAPGEGDMVRDPVAGDIVRDMAATLLRLVRNRYLW